MKNYILVIICVSLLVGCMKTSKIIVPFSNSEIEYWGRIDTLKNEAVNLYWSGTSVKMNFEGASVKVLLKDTNGDNYYNVIIDGKVAKVIQPDTTKKYYELADNLSEGKHSLELFKRTEWDRGTTFFYGFEIANGGKVLPKSTPKKRTIVFYGNSITAGYAVDDVENKDRPDSIYTNHYKSYAAITARHFNAKFHTICKSGIGVTISWFPLTMPQLYDRLVPENPKSKWDFSKYQPDIVIVNLFQNDSWLVEMPEEEQFNTVFGAEPPNDEFLVNAYENFIINLREKYPSSQIICMLGNMDATKEGAKWPNLITKAVKKIEDDKIFTHFVPYKNTPNHPTAEEQVIMSKSLITFIKKNITW